MGLRPSVAQRAPVGPFQHRLGPPRPQRSQKGPAFPGLQLWWTPSLRLGARGEGGEPPWGQPAHPVW